MEIVLGKTAGFCYGVKRAVDEAKKEIENNKNIYCVGELVHNKSVIRDLEEKGIRFVNSIDEVKEKIIIRAHGISKDIYEKLEQKGIKIKDLTCPNVLKTHTIAEKYRKENYFIVLLGTKNHPESIGTLSFCGNNSFLLQENEDIEECIENINKSVLNKVLIMAQTTYNSKKFDDIVEILKYKIKNKNIEVQKTICGATEVRQKETTQIARNVEVMIIIGDKKSSNTNKLYDISKENCKKVIFVQNAEELNLKELDGIKKIGIMAGASTPKEDIDEIIKKIRSKKI